MKVANDKSTFVFPNNNESVAVNGIDLFEN